MTTRERRVSAREVMLRRALEVAVAYHGLSDESASVTDVMKAEERMELAARDLTNAVDDMPPGDRPRKWALVPDGETA